MCRFKSTAVKGRAPGGREKIPKNKVIILKKMVQEASEKHRE